MSSVSVAQASGREAVLVRERVVPAVALATVASLVVFMSAQTILLLRAHHVMWEMYLHLEGPHFAEGMVGSIWPDVLFGTGRFCGLMLSGLTLAAVGRRRTYAIPALAWLLLSLSHGPDVMRLPHPFPISVGWWPIPGTSVTDLYWWAYAWVGSVIDYTLALLPAAVLVSGLRRTGALGQEHARRLSLPGPTTAATFALTGLILTLTMYTAAVSVDALYPWAQVPAMLPLFLFGLLLGTQRRSLLWAAVAVPFVVQVDWFAVLSPGSTSLMHTALTTLPFVGVTGLGILPGPGARVLERLRAAPLSALVLLNVLNVADAVLTWVAVDSKQAVEANPIVRMLGLPAKVMLVAAISLVLYRRRPRALAWTVMIFLGVIAWHVAGMYLTANT